MNGTVDFTLVSLISREVHHHVVGTLQQPKEGSTERGTGAPSCQLAPTWFSVRATVKVNPLTKLCTLIMFCLLYTNYTSVELNIKETPLAPAKLANDCSPS